MNQMDSLSFVKMGILGIFVLPALLIRMKSMKGKGITVALNALKFGLTY